MKSEPTIMHITHIGKVETVTGFNNKVDRRQVIRFLEPAYIHPTDSTKNGKEQPFEVEVWNSGIEKYKLNERYVVGSEVAVILWMNGKVKHTGQGDKHSTQLAIYSIKNPE